MSCSVSSSSSSSSESQWKFYYDVFLTFRTKSPSNSISSLVASLRESSLEVFVDDNNNNDKELMAYSALGSIERSRVVIVVFTKEFGDSRICLEKLEKIMVRREMDDKSVLLPVFCDVSKEELQRGRLTEGFERLIEEKCLSGSEESNYRRVLAEATSLPHGSVLFSSGHISYQIRDIIELIKKKLDTSYELHPAGQHCLVGLQSHVEEVLRLVDNNKKRSLVGICGIEGIGKTTIARVIYDTIDDRFERTSFLANIQNMWEKNNGQVHLQEKLISDIFGGKHEKIDDVKMEMREIERVLRNKSALVVYDDVSRRDQLKALCGDSGWFGSGSLIIITTRSKKLLDYLKVKTVYELKRLNYSESRQLFNWHAFKQRSPTNNFFPSRKVITYCEGLPLALKVFGSLLLDKTIPDWRIVLKKLKGIPDGEIQKKLKISYDFLDDLEKDLFFNIVSFYVGKSKHYVMQSLKGSKFSVEMGMQKLIERSLVEVDKNDKLDVHDLLQEIGRGSNSNKPSKYKYNVFLSFRGEDTRKSFTTHLYTALKQAGIVEVFMDDRIERGENISSSLLEAIENSRISIIIFSKDYAGSSWCLQELEKIMECHITIGQEVLPIFYDVRPSDVRKQLNTFGEASTGLTKRTSVSKDKELIITWRRVLNEAANLSGWDMHNYRTETELINHVVETIIMKLDDNTYMFVAHHPVGLKPRLQDIIQLLSSKSNEVIIAGIWGMGGIGKTTLAKAIYNEIGQNFEGKCFLTNIREVWKQDNGQVSLQEQLLSSILKTRRITLPSVELGKTRMKDCLCHKRVLVVLDDVNNVDQINVLCGSRDWFGRGSRIIITTRDKHLLKILKMVHEYDVKEMDNNESLELFSWHAFKQAIPERDLFELSRRVVSYCGGLPLALEVLGSYLCDREIIDWEGVLKKLQQIPNDQIYEKLKISYDGLSDSTEKDTFLDICCFFIGKDRNYVTQILNGCGFHADIGITRLIELSLVKVDNKNKLDMHDLLRDMGREIIREKSPEEPENRTRLWLHEDVLEVLRNDTGTIAVKGIALNLSENHTLSLSIKAFKEMKKLRLLQLDHVRLVGDYKYLSKNLRWLYWHGFPLESLPMNFSQEKVIAIDLRYSNLSQVWKKSQLLEWLKILNLSHSHYLRQTPDFSKIPNLEKLILKDCPRLSIVDPTIGDLKYIILVNLKNCKDLSHLPRRIYNLTSLKTLNLSGCSKIGKLEEDIVQMGSLTTLLADQTAITQVPFSLVRLKSINYVSLCGYEGASRNVFPSLVWSWMSPTNNPKSLIQGFRNMPYLLKGLSHRLFGKSNPMSETRPSTSQVLCKKSPTSDGFLEQVHKEGSENFTSTLTIQVGRFIEVTDTLLKSISQVGSERGFDGYSLPGDNYPHWLNFKGEGSSVLFDVPHVSGNVLTGLILCIVYLSPSDRMASAYPVSVLVSNRTKETIEFYKRDETTSNDQEWHNIISNLEPGNEVEVKITFARKLTLKKTSIYLVYGKDVGKRIMY